MPKPKAQTIGKPAFRASGSDASKRARFQPWTFRRSKPGKYLVRKVFCAAVKFMIVKTMSMHEFQFDGKIYRQKLGGSIRLGLFGVVSDI